VVYERFGALVGLAEPMRRKLVEVPFSLDHPWWIDDADFDLEYHVRHIGLAPPGGADQLTEQVSRIVGRQMDRTRPLWEVYVIEGLADGRWAMLTKLHHATIDGAAGVILLNMLTDTDPNAPAPEPVEWKGEQPPSQSELLQHTLQHLAPNPVKGMRMQLKLVRNLADVLGVTSVSKMAGHAREAIKTIASRGQDDAPDHERRIQLPLTPAPATPWNKPITAHRRFAMRGTSLENLKALKNATGGTLNDVVMAICAGALREYLIKHDALPDKPLRAMVPVSIRTGNEADVWTNLVSSIIADLPTHIADPLERVAACARGDDRRQAPTGPHPADILSDVTQTASPVVATAAHPPGVAHVGPGEPADERHHLQRARPAPTAVLRRRQARRVHPGLHRHRRHGPQHHRAQLPRPDGVRHHRRSRVGARRVGHGRHAHRRDRSPVRSHRHRLGRAPEGAIDAPRQHLREAPPPQPPAPESAAAAAPAKKAAAKKAPAKKVAAKKAAPVKKAAAKKAAAKRTK
jgi:WS/DGAT/MGAT family acyltransferase